MSCCEDEPTVYGLVRDLFCASAVTCFLWALHRIANGLIVQGRVAAYDELSDSYTPEERELLVHEIKRGSLRY